MSDPIPYPNEHEDLGLGCREIAGRMILAVVFVICALNVSACRSPIIEINRTGPLISSEIQVNDSLHNNELPLIK